MVSHAVACLRGSGINHTTVCRRTALQWCDKAPMRYSVVLVCAAVLHQSVFVMAAVPSVAVSIRIVPWYTSVDKHSYPRCLEWWLLSLGVIINYQGKMKRCPGSLWPKIKICPRINHISVPFRPFLLYFKVHRYYCPQEKKVSVHRMAAF